MNRSKLLIIFCLSLCAGEITKSKVMNHAMHPNAKPRKQYMKGAGCNWEKVAKKTFRGHNTQHVTGASVDDCKRICCETLWCKSFKYGRGDNDCLLSKVDAYDVGGLVTYSEDPYDYYGMVEVDAPSSYQMRFSLNMYYAELQTCKTTNKKKNAELETCETTNKKKKEELKTCGRAFKTYYEDSHAELKTCNEKGAETEENLRRATSKQQELSKELAKMTEERDRALKELNENKDALKEALEEVEVQNAKCETEKRRCGIALLEALAVVHGSWSDFGDFGECSTQCGRGFKTRFRTCDHPKPKNGGDECIGQMESVAQCQGPKKFEFVTEEGFCSEAHTELAVTRSLPECEEQCENDPSCTVVVQDEHGCVTLSTCSELPAKETGSFVHRKSSCGLSIDATNEPTRRKLGEKKN